MKTPSYKKFMFDLDFDELYRVEAEAAAEAEKTAAENENEDAEETPEPEPEPDLPTYTEEDLQAAQDEGFEKGREEGIREAGSTIEQRTADTLTVIQQQIDSLFQAQTEANQSLTEDAVAVAAALIRKLFPTMVEQTATDEVGQMVKDAVSRLITEPSMTVRVAAELVDGVRERVESIATQANYSGAITVIGEDDMAIGDSRLEWEAGGVERNVADLFDQLEAIVETHLGRPLAPTPAADAGPAVQASDAQAPDERAPDAQAEDEQAAVEQSPDVQDQVVQDQVVQDRDEPGTAPDGETLVAADVEPGATEAADETTDATRDALETAPVDAGTADQAPPASRDDADAPEELAMHEEPAPDAGEPEPEAGPEEEEPEPAEEVPPTDDRSILADSTEPAADSPATVEPPTTEEAASASPAQEGPETPASHEQQDEDPTDVEAGDLPGGPKGQADLGGQDG